MAKLELPPLRIAATIVIPLITRVEDHGDRADVVVTAGDPVIEVNLDAKTLVGQPDPLPPPERIGAIGPLNDALTALEPTLRANPDLRAYWLIPEGQLRGSTLAGLDLLQTVNERQQLVIERLP